MSNSTSTITCSVDGCDRPGTRHADYEQASLYCDQHGNCSGCGLSVEHFKHVVDEGASPKGHQWSLDVWLCPCVADRRRMMETPRPVYEPKEAVEAPKKTVQGYWGKTA
jgi:hypothetical protein